MLMRCASGSPLATYAAPISPPAPSLFSTITAWPRIACSFSATMRAVVSDALPGVTPETRRMVLLGNAWAKAIAGARASVAISAHRLSAFMVSSPFRPSDPGQPKLPGEPVGRPAAVTVRTIVGVVTAVLDDQEFHRAGDGPGQPLGVRRRHQPVLPPGYDENGTGNSSSSVSHRQRRRVLQGLGLARAVAAHAESLPGQTRQRGPDLLPLEWAGERDAGADALLISGRARRVVAAAAHAPHGDLRRIAVGAPFDPIAERTRGAFVVAADGNVVLRLALPRPVDREDRDPPGDARLFEAWRA